MIRLQADKGRIHIALQAIPMGADWCILLTGGDLPHLGAVSLSSGVTSAFPLHREGEVTRRAVQKLEPVLSANFVVCCGIHLDDITREEIAAVLALCDGLMEKLVEQILTGGGA